MCARAMAYTKSQHDDGNFQPASFNGCPRWRSCLLSLLLLGVAVTGATAGRLGIGTVIVSFVSCWLRVDRLATVWSGMVDSHC